MQKFVLSNLREFLGLQNIKTAMTGAAPVPPELLRWLMAVGIELLEAFGMTETCGFCTSMPPDQLTPTMKLKRKVVARKYADTMAGMYGSGEYRQEQD